MNLQETKDITIGDLPLKVVRLNSFKRLALIADLQKDFIKPLMENDCNGANPLSIKDNLSKIDTQSAIKFLSNTVDSQILEKWLLRILNDGMVVYVRADNQLVKFGFSDINSLQNPSDIILLMKEAIVFNLVGINDLISIFTRKSN